MKNNFLICLALITLPNLVFGQWTDNGATPTNPFDFNITTVRRGNTGVGFIDQFDYATKAGTSGARFLVEGGILGHYVNGTVGSFSGKWCGLGEGNPGAPPGSPAPYGLGVAFSDNVAFYNLLKELFNGAGRVNTIAGFGANNGPNNNRFIIRGYSGAFAATGRDILIANPNGSVSINTEPTQAGPDLSTTFYVDGTVSNARFKSIFINNNTLNAANTVIARSFSAIGQEGNTNVAGVPLEGFRAQVLNNTFPITTNQIGTSVNLLVGIDPNAPAPPVISTAANAFGGEFADLYWQDLGYFGAASTNPAALPVATAQALDKFTISFRNAQNTGPFVPGNRLPVMTFQGNGRVGIGQVAPVSPISFFGPNPVLLDVNGGVFSNINFFISDRRLKKDIAPVEDAMSLIRKLQGTTYNFRTDEFPEKNLPGGKHYGFIAQDLEKVIPEASMEGDNGFYGVDYNALIPVLTEAMKEQDKVITELRNEIAELRSQFNDLKAGQTPGSLEGFRLDQNAPNPASGSTVIGFALPTGTTGARITVYDLTGRTVKSWLLNETEGQIRINAGELSSGLYIYDLQWNGRQLLERKMTIAAN